MLNALILAAGQGTRMKSELPKVLHEVAFMPLVKWVLKATSFADGQTVVIGHCGEAVQQALGEDVNYAWQRELLGTGHAVMQAKECLDTCDTVLIVSGDTPLITEETLLAAYKQHQQDGNAVTVLTAKLDDPKGYGRIVRSKTGAVQKIVEQKDATLEQAAICEINSGMYFFNSELLSLALSKLNNNNAQAEYYLTDTLELLLQDGHSVGAYLMDDAGEILGINDRSQLAVANEIMRNRIVAKHMANGVTFLSPQTALIGGDVKIGSDTVILPNCILRDGTEIGSHCEIGPNTQMKHSIVGDYNDVNSSVMTDSVIGNHVHVGPFAYLRPGSKIGNHIKIGDFVEIKNSTIEDGTKVSHLTYVGDADVGKNVNFGCGTVLVNYNGSSKFRSTIHDNAFIGCNTNLVSPVTVKEGAFIAAGSTITEDIPEHALAIARSRQVVKKDWKRK